jgi:hypothetical protein
MNVLDKKMYLIGIELQTALKSKSLDPIKNDKSYLNKNKSGVYLVRLR